MLTPVLNNKEFVELMKTIQQSKRIVVCAHRGPDGDAFIKYDMARNGNSLEDEWEYLGFFSDNLEPL